MSDTISWSTETPTSPVAPRSGERIEVTPRTDKVYIDMIVSPEHPIVVLSAQLERELAAMTRERDALVQMSKHSDHTITVYAETTKELRAEVERLRALLRLFDGHACKCAHHAKKDQHPIGTPCPIEQRIRAALGEEEQK